MEWDFEAHTPTLRDADTGEDHSAAVRGKREDVMLGEHLLDIGLDEFREACCLHQEAVSGVASSEDLVLVLQRSVETGTQDIGVADADGRLSEFLRDRLGVHSGHYGNLAKGPLAQRGQALREARARLEAVKSERAQIESTAEDVEHRRAERRKVAERLEYARQRLALAELEALEAKRSKAHELRSQQSQRPPDPVRLPQSVTSDVRTGFEGRDRTRERLERLQQESRAADPELERIADEQRQRQAEVDALALYGTIEGRQEDHVRELAARLQALPAQASDQAGAEVAERDPQLARYREERVRLTELSRTQGGSDWHGTRLIAGVLVALLSTAAGVLVHPLAFTGLLLAAVVVVAARRATRPAGGELDDALRTYGVASLDELERLAAEEDQRVARAEGIARERARREEEAHSERVRLDGELRAALDSAGATPRDALDERASAYLEACRKHRQLIEAQADLRSLEGQRLSAEQPARELAKVQRERQAIEDELRAALRTLEIDADDLEDARERYAELERRAVSEETLTREAETATRELGALLGDETLERLERRIEEAKQVHREHVTRHGRLAEEPGDADELTRGVEELRSELGSIDLDLREKEASIATREAALPEPAALREEIARLEAEIERMELARDGIRVAREALVAAAAEAHREFAPHLNAALERNLARITAGRYDDATVDEGLEIRVRAPETGKLVRVDQLSRGTQDQIYLVERLEIAKLLDPTTGEAPLLLDDPFARFDEGRLRLGLEVIRDVAAERQVVLFSEDADLLDSAREICGECGVIELEGPLAVAVR